MPSVTSYQIDASQASLSDYSGHRNYQHVGGNRYWFGPDSNLGVAGSATDHRVYAWKSADGHTWTKQDAAGSPSCKYQPGATSLHGAHVISAAYDSARNCFWVAYLAQNATAGIGFLRFAPFDCSTDTWGSEITGGPDCYLVRGHQTQLESYQIAMVALANGDLRFVYNGATELVAGKNYDRVYTALYTPGTGWISSDVALLDQTGVTRFFWLDGIVANGSITHVQAHSSDDSATEWRLHHWSVNASSGLSALATIATDGWVGVDNGENYGSVPIDVGGKLLFFYSRNDGSGNERIGCYVGSPSTSSSPTWGGSPEDPTAGADFSYFAVGASGSGNGIPVVYANGDFQAQAWTFDYNAGGEPCLFWNWLADNVIFATKRSSGGSWSAAVTLTLDVSHSVAGLTAGNNVLVTAAPATGGNYTTMQ